MHGEGSQVSQVSVAQETLHFILLYIHQDFSCRKEMYWNGTLITVHHVDYYFLLLVYLFNLMNDVVGK